MSSQTNAVSPASFVFVVLQTLRSVFSEIMCFYGKNSVLYGKNVRKSNSGLNSISRYCVWHCEADVMQHLWFPNLPVVYVEISALIA